MGNKLSRKREERERDYTSSGALTPYHTRYDSYTEDAARLNRQLFRQSRILTTVDYRRHGVETGQ